MNRTLQAHTAPKIRITVGYPRFKLPGYDLAGTIPELAPERAWFQKSEKVFTALYTTRLLQHGVQLLARRFMEAAVRSESTELILCCFENLTKPGEWCHRRIFAAWWEARTGQAVDELPEH